MSNDKEYTLDCSGLSQEMLSTLREIQQGSINIETYSGNFEDAPLSTNEIWAYKTNNVSLYIIKDWRVKLKRELTYKELLVLEACEKNGILLSEDDFKPFSG